MTFTQIVETRVADEATLVELARAWHRDQYGVAPGYLGSRILADRERDQCYLLVVDFASQADAEKNNDRPETQEWAGRLQGLATSAPEYRNTQQVYSSYDGAAG